MNDILRPSGGNPGGIQFLQFSPAYAVNSFPSINDCEIVTDVTFKPDFRWYKIETIENSLDYECEVIETDNGPNHIIKVTGVIRGDEATIKKSLNNLMDINSFYLKVKDNAGMTVLVGYGQETLSFNYKKKSGTGLPGLRSYQFTFFGEFTIDPPIYNL